MAGAFLQFDENSQQVADAVAKVERLYGNLEEPFQDIGEYLINAHHERFRLQQSPDGEPWAPLSEGYRKRKKRNQDLILVLNGYLRDMPRYQATPQALMFGTDRIYGATQQFGDDSRGIPARPWLGLSPDDRREVMAILDGYMEDGINDIR